VNRMDMTNIYYLDHLLTPEARVLKPASPRGICGGQSVTGTFLSRKSLENI
jgi:hypothetical protein